MSNFKFVSHQAFPEDQYTKEVVYLSLEDKYRVAFLRKQAKNGGMFWSVMSTAIAHDGNKSFYEAFLMDSSFLEKDIKHFLENRLWESKALAKDKDDCPF